jgi:hypothetical protein
MHVDASSFVVALQGHAVAFLVATIITTIQVKPTDASLLTTLCPIHAPREQQFFHCP